MAPTAPATQKADQSIPTIQSIISVVWPSFLTASAATILFFVMFDPLDLGQLLDLPALSRTAGYTAGFFGFWFLTSISCALTCYFRRPCQRTQQKSQAE